MASSTCLAQFLFGFQWSPRFQHCLPSIVRQDQYVRSLGLSRCTLVWQSVSQARHPALQLQPGLRMDIGAPRCIASAVCVLTTPSRMRC